MHQIYIIENGEWVKIREWVKIGSISILPVETSVQLADAMTKALPDLNMNF